MQNSSVQSANSCPVRYDYSLETPEKDEAETITGLIDAISQINETTFRDNAHATRGAHAKSHGLLRGQMRVMDNLPSDYAQGIFAKPGTYSVVMRLSTAPGDMLDDKVSTSRGLALKVIGVEGNRLPGSEGDQTQDFVMVNGPAFLVPNAKKFLANFKLLAATTDKAEGLKKALSAALQGVEKTVEMMGGESAKIKNMGGHPETNILGETFFTQVPLLYGPYMAKVSVVPATPSLQSLKDQPVDMKDKPNALREAVQNFFASQQGIWDVKVQLCTDLNTMPIEDASVVWPEDQSPYVTVAQITVAPQESWNESLSAQIDDRMSFSPWHGIADHRPLGSIMRVRKAAYESSVRFRGNHNGCPIMEPKAGAAGLTEHGLDH